MITLCEPCLKGQEWELVKQCLDTNWVSYVGPFVDRFEQELAAKAGSQYAVATSSGTAALHIALIMAGVRQDDEVVMPGLSFVAPANAVRYCGAWPTFTDVRKDDWQWDVEKLGSFLRSGCQFIDGRLVNRESGRTIAALLPIHLLGATCDIDAVVSLAKEFDLPVIEDAAECLGALYKGKPIGFKRPGISSARHFVATSFNGNKIITTGGGGAILTNSEEMAVKAKHLSTTAKVGGLDFYHDAIGYNYRLTNMAAALGVSQLEQLNDHVEAKRAIAQRYEEAFGDLEITVHPEPAYCRSTFWMYSVLLECESRPVIERLNDEGIMARPLWVPLSDLPAFTACHPADELSVVNHLYKHGLSLPCSVGLSEGDQARVITAIAKHEELHR